MLKEKIIKEFEFCGRSRRVRGFIELLVVLASSVRVKVVMVETAAKVVVAGLIIALLISPLARVHAQGDSQQPGTSYYVELVKNGDFSSGLLDWSVDNSELFSVRRFTESTGHKKYGDLVLEFRVDHSNPSGVYSGRLSQTLYLPKTSKAILSFLCFATVGPSNDGWSIRIRIAGSKTNLTTLSDWIILDGYHHEIHRLSYDITQLSGQNIIIIIELQVNHHGGWLGYDDRVYIDDISIKYIPMVNVTFSASGLGSDVSGVVLVVDGTTYSYSQLPVILTWDAGSTHSFAWAEAVNSTIAGKRYVWVSASGLSTSRGGSIVAECNGSVTASYKAQYQSPPSARNESVQKASAPGGERLAPEGVVNYGELIGTVLLLALMSLALFIIAYEYTLWRRRRLAKIIVPSTYKETSRGEARRCPRCNAEIRDPTARYCWNCGRKLD